MRRLPAILLLALSITVVGCSSSSSSSTAPSDTPSAAAPASSAPAESAAASAVPSSAPSLDNAAFGAQYAQIQADLQSELSKITASMATATTPAKLAAIYQQYADVTKKAIAAQRAIAWPAGISSDMDKLLADEDELMTIFQKLMTDPTAATDQQRMAAIEAEMPALAQKIAAFFGVPTTP